MPEHQIIDLLCMGIDHHIATVHDRALLAFDQQTRSSLRAEIDHAGGVGVVLCTCHRTEIIASGLTPRTLRRIVSEHVSQHARHLVDRMVMRAGEAAMSHIMRVSCGLESALLGEVEVLGQLRQAIREAASERRLRGVLDRVLRSAIHLGRRVRQHTDIAKGTATLSSAACAIVREHLPTVASTVVVLGGGEMARAVVHNLHTTWGRSSLFIANRTPERIADLASIATTIPWDVRSTSIQTADAVIIAVGGTEPACDVADLQRTVICVDLSMPTKVQGGAHPAVWTIDRVGASVDRTNDLRRESIPIVEGMIFEEMCAYHRWSARRMVREVAA